MNELENENSAAYPVSPTVVADNAASSPTSSKALQLSEKRYRRLFETAQDGILLLNAETAQIEDVNPFLIELLGYSYDEFLGKKIWEIGAFKEGCTEQGSICRASEDALHPLRQPSSGNKRWTGRI